MGVCVADAEKVLVHRKSSVTPKSLAPEQEPSYANVTALPGFAYDGAVVSKDVVLELQPAPRHMMEEPNCPVTAKCGPLTLFAKGVSTVKLYVSPGCELTRFSTHERRWEGCAERRRRDTQSERECAAGGAASTQPRRGSTVRGGADCSLTPLPQFPPPTHSGAARQVATDDGAAAVAAEGRHLDRYTRRRAHVHLARVRLIPRRWVREDVGPV